MDSNFDEKVMIREQERLAKEEKRKKRKKKIVILIIVMVVLLIAGGVIWFLLKKNQKEQDQVKIEVSAGQTMVVAKIVSINGNEVVYQVGEKVGEVSLEEEASADFEKGENTQNPGRGERPSGSQMPDFGLGEMPDMSQMPGGGEMPGFGSGEMPDMSQMPGGSEMPDFGSGEMPDMNQMPGGGEMPDFGSGEMPDMSQMPGGGQMPDFGSGEMPDMSQMPGFGAGERPQRDENGGTMGATTGQFVYDSAIYEFTEETITAYIPVGSAVITKLGAETTFSRLEQGDYVAFVIEKDGDEEIIVATYIIG